MVKELDSLSATIILEVTNKMEYLADKYAITMHDIQQNKASIKTRLSEMVSLLTAQGADAEGLNEFYSILGGQRR